MAQLTESRILIVDDIEENLMVLTDTLVQEGFHPLQAKSGERAIQIAKAAQPDLILLDIRMPGMDGFETIKVLKSDPATVDIPVIFISALNQVDDKVQGFKSGAVDYVSKPFQKEEVVARVSTHLKLRQAQRLVELERQKSERLLLNMLPRAVVEELKENGCSVPQHFEDVSILFTDLVNFTEKSQAFEPSALIAELNELFSGFDAIMLKHNCERIKTIGDAYFAVSGMPTANPDHARSLVAAAKDMVALVEARNASASCAWEIRLGIHSGPVVAGIVGTHKYIYDVFGDSVNTASRMEANSLPMRINLSKASADLVRPHYQLEARPPVEVKGKGSMEMYFLVD